MAALAARVRSPLAQNAGSWSPLERKPGSGQQYTSAKRRGTSYCACPGARQYSDNWKEISVNGEEAATTVFDAGMHKGDVPVVLP